MSSVLRSVGRHAARFSRSVILDAKVVISVHGGNGRDIISVAWKTSPQRFGWYTYIDQRDGAEDLIAVKSDQFLHNYWYESSGNIHSAIRQM